MHPKHTQDEILVQTDNINYFTKNFVFIIINISPSAFIHHYYNFNCMDVPFHAKKSISYYIINLYFIYFS